MFGKELTNEEKLNEILKLSEENNRILHGLRRQNYVSNILRGIYWIIIIVSLGGAYFFIQQIGSAFSGDVGGLTKTLEQVNAFKSQLPEVKMLQKVLEGMTTGSSTE